MLIPANTKNWDAHVSQAEIVARSPGFQHLRDRIIDLAEIQPDECVVDVGAGTGLLSLESARRGARVWAVDISPSMCEYLRAKARTGGHQIEVAVGSAVSLPIVDGFADAVVSNYCFHHLDDAGKLQALAEARRVLRPGGRLVFGDMMFTLDPRDPRDRAVVEAKVRAMLRKGPAGFVRLARNGLRVATGRWESPVRASWWQQAMLDARFDDVSVLVLEHEGGLAHARRPLV